MVSLARFATTTVVRQQLRGKFKVLFLIIVIEFSARAVSGYSLEGQKWLTNPIMQMSLGNAGRVLLDGNTNWNYAASPALDMWNQAIRRIQFGRALNSGIAPAERDGFNSMAFSNTVFGQTWGSNALATTIYWYSGMTMTEADILLNNTQSWDSYRGPRRYNGSGLIADVQRVALHELGHVIGLDHPDDDGQNVDAIMNSTISDRYTLSPDDIAGAQRLYSQTPKVDMFMQNNSTGERGILNMCATTQCYDTNLGVVSTQWNIVASAAFGYSNNYWDIVWQNSSTGQCIVWFMQDTHCPGCNPDPTHVGTAVLPTVPPSWEIAAAGDFNGRGQADILLQNIATGQRVIWFMNRTTRTASWNLGVVPTEWKIVGTGDFNGDSKTDILWQDNITGQRAIWLMNGAQRIGIVDLGTVGTDWNIVGTGDFNGDGKPDVVWQNQNTGQYVIWLMNGIQRTNIVSVGFLPTEWKIRNY